jgi:hypothetical protein
MPKNVLGRTTGPVRPISLQFLALGPSFEGICVSIGSSFGLKIHLNLTPRIYHDDRFARSDAPIGNEMLFEGRVSRTNVSAPR